VLPLQADLPQPGDSDFRSERFEPFPRFGLTLCTCICKATRGHVSLKFHSVNLSYSFCAIQLLTRCVARRCSWCLLPALVSNDKSLLSHACGFRNIPLATSLAVLHKRARLYLNGTLQWPVRFLPIYALVVTLPIGNLSPGSALSRKETRYCLCSSGVLP
jgi:hypothetical protein